MLPTELLERRPRRSPRLTVTTAIVVGLVLLVGSVALGMRWPNASRRAGPSDATRFDDSALAAPLRPLTDDYVEARSKKEPTERAPADTDTRPRPSAQAPAPVRPAKEARAGYPSAAACSVDNSGMAPGETRSCRFTATEAGGWQMFWGGVDAGSGWSAVVSVTREGTSKRYTAGSAGMRGGGRDGRDAEDGYCADGVIVPGDLVDVQLTQGSVEVSVATLGAGYHWDCSHARGD